MSNALWVERLWDEPKEQLADFLRSNIESLRRLSPAAATEGFTARMLEEGFGYSSERGELVWLEDERCWSIVIDDEKVALVVAVPARGTLGKWVVSDVTESAIARGVDWIWLTNGAEWRVYRRGPGSDSSMMIEFLSAALLDGASVERQAERLLLISRAGVVRGALSDVWNMREVLRPERIMAALNSDSVTSAIVGELSSWVEPDQEAVYSVMLSEIGLDAIRSALDPDDALLRLPLFVLRSVVEFVQQDL